VGAVMKTNIKQLKRAEQKKSGGRRLLTAAGWIIGKVRSSSLLTVITLLLIADLIVYLPNPWVVIPSENISYFQQGYKYNWDGQSFILCAPNSYGGFSATINPNDRYHRQYYWPAHFTFGWKAVIHKYVVRFRPWPYETCAGAGEY